MNEMTREVPTTVGGPMFKVDLEDYSRTLEVGSRVGWIVRDGKVYTKAGMSIGRFILGVTNSHTRIYHVNDDYLDARRSNLSLRKNLHVSPVEIRRFTCGGVYFNESSLEAVLRDAARQFAEGFIEEQSFRTQEVLRDNELLKAEVSMLRTRIASSLGIRVDPLGPIADKLSWSASEDKNFTESGDDQIINAYSTEFANFLIKALSENRAKFIEESHRMTLKLRNKLR